MSAVLIPIIVILVAVFAAAIWIDMRRRRSNSPPFGDDRARRMQSEADRRSQRPR